MMDIKCESRGMEKVRGIEKTEEGRSYPGAERSGAEEIYRY